MSHLGALLAYDASGRVVATCDWMVVLDELGSVVGVRDFLDYEAQGLKLRDLWVVQYAVGSGAWPEWLGMKAHDFRVELDSGRRISALIHASGYRRDRAEIETAVQQRIADAQGAVDLRDLVGGPNAPLLLDTQGRTLGRSVPSIA